MNRISKKAILESCLNRQDELITGFEKRVAEAKSDAYGHQDSPSQDEETAAAKLDVVTMLEEELGFARYERAILEEIDPDEILDQVQKGAVVVTDQRLFFIGVSTEEVEVNGNKVFGMSEKAPLYLEMRTKKKGETASFNGTSYRIEDVY